MPISNFFLEATSKMYPCPDELQEFTNFYKSS